ncbi:MAG: DUF4292 domain-containing protein [Bacteroidetes bacterium]|nr:DUF4292 domain-containing protein [Bacteroidota bacterium]
MNKLFTITLISSVILFDSCNMIRPFFIKNKKKETRKENRTEKKIERKENKIEKKQDKVSELKNTISKSDSLPTIKKESLIVLTPDTAYANRLINTKKINYTTFQCKAKMHFESETEKQNFNIHFRIKKDSVIWASINAPIIGEVARALITPDSVKAFERMNKKQYLYSYKDIQKLINLQVDFSTLQELILGNAIATDGTITDIKVLGPLANIFIKGIDYTSQLTYTKEDSTLKQIQLQTARSTTTSSLLIVMNQYQPIGLRFLPVQRQYTILDLKGAIQLDMDINKAEFDIEVDFPFTIPKNFTLQD